MKFTVEGIQENFTNVELLNTKDKYKHLTPVPLCIFRIWKLRFANFWINPPSFHSIVPANKNSFRSAAQRQVSKSISEESREISPMFSFPFAAFFIFYFPECNLLRLLAHTHPRFSISNILLSKNTIQHPKK